MVKKVSVSKKKNQSKQNKEIYINIKEIFIKYQNKEMSKK